MQAKIFASTTKCRAQGYLEPFRLASRPVTCAEYLRFMEDGDIHDPSCGSPRAGRRCRRSTGRRRSTGVPRQRIWQVFTLGGLVDLDDLLATPVCHISYFEADAYARWAGKCLPTKQSGSSRRGDSGERQSARSETFHPQAAPPASEKPELLYGDVWEWTVSAYLPYPGFDPLPGALGEYNGKFMCNQMVLRGGSVVTPASHIRATYRNFFAPATRWQFSGVRLADH